MNGRSREEQIADQRLVDAMLRGLRLDTTASLDGRCARVQEAIQSGQQSERARPATRVRGRRSWHTVTKAALGGVSALAAVVMITVLLQPSPVSATALLERAQSFELQSATGDRRYAVTIAPPHHGGGMPMLSGILDVRDGEHMRFDLQQPNGKHHIWGMGPTGPWQLPPNGTPQRDAKGRWPRWLEGTSQALLIDTMPALLDIVLGGYDAVSTSESGVTTIVAIQRNSSEGGPDEIVIELDRADGGVASLELRWEPSSEERWRRGRSQARTGEGLHRSPPAGVRPPRRPDVSEGDRNRDRARSPNDRRGAHHRRPGGPPAPKSIRFDRVSSEPVGSDWFTAPESGDTQETDF